MTDIADLSVRVTINEQFDKQLETAFDKSAAKVEKRGSKMTDSIRDKFEKAFEGLASGRLSKVFDRSAEQVEEKFEESADGIEARFGKLGDNLKGTFGKIGIGIAGGLAFDSALSQFDTLETKAAEVLTLLPNQSALAFDALSEDVLDFQEDLRIATEDAVPALYQAISAGQGEDPFGFLEVAQQAAVGGITDLKTSVSALAGTVNAFSDESVTATRVSDTFFTGVKLGVTTFGELAREMPKVTSTAAALGVELEDVTAAVTALTLNGIDTARAATFLNGALVELAKSGTKASDTFTDLNGGVSFTEFIEEGNTFADAITLIAEASEETDLSVLDMFGSIEAGRAVLALTKDGGEQLQQTLTSMGSSFGSTAQAAETLDATAARTRIRIAALIQTAQQRFGAQVAPFVTELLVVFEELLPTVIDLAEALGGTFAIALQVSLPVIKVAAGAIEVFVSALNAVPAPLLAAAIAYAKFSNNTLSTVAALSKLGKSLVASTTSMGAFGKVSAASSAGFAKAAKGLNAVRVALPLIAVGVVAAVTVWNKYKSIQEEAAFQAEAYGQAVRANTTPQVEQLSARVRDLIVDFGLLESAQSQAGFGELTDEGAGLLAVIEESDKVFNGFGTTVSETFDKLKLGFLGAESFDVEANEALDGLSNRLKAVGADLDILGRASLNNKDILNDIALTENILKRLGETASLSSDELASIGADASLGPALVELERLAKTGNLTEAELRALVASMGDASDAATAFAAELENNAAEALADIRARGNDTVDTIIDNALAMDQVKNSAAPMTAALSVVEKELLAIGDTDADGKIDDTGEALRDVQQRATDAGLSLEDVAEAYDELTGPLTNVKTLMSEVLGLFRDQFDLALTVREATAGLAEAYDDLAPGFEDITAVDLSGQVEELAEVQTTLDELRSGLNSELSSGDGPRAAEIREEIAASQEQAAQLQETIQVERELAGVRREAVRDLDLNEQAGRDANDLLVSYAQAAREVAEASLAEGASIAEVNAALQVQETQLLETAQNLGVSERAALDFVNTLDLTPDSVKTLIELVGPDAALTDISAHIASLDTIPEDVKTEVALLGDDATITQILEILEKAGLLDKLKPQVEVDVEVTGDSSAEDILALATEIDQADASVDIGETGADSATLALGEVENAANDVDETDPNVDVSVTGNEPAIQNLIEVEIAADDVDAADPTVEVEAITATALGELVDFRSVLADLDGRRSTVFVDTVTSSLPGAEAGGVFDVPGTGVPVAIGEAGREYAINVENPKHRNRSIALLRAAARDLGLQVGSPTQRVGTPAVAAPAAGGDTVTPEPSSIGPVSIALTGNYDEATLARLLRIEVEGLLTEVSG